MKKKILAVMLMMVLAQPAGVFAASPWTSAESYGDKVTGKLDFGLKNLLGGWTELYTEPADAWNAKDESVPVAMGRGIANAVVYTIGGLIHTATFLIPVDVPIPNNGLE